MSAKGLRNGSAVDLNLASIVASEKLERIHMSDDRLKVESAVKKTEKIKKYKHARMVIFILVNFVMYFVAMDFGSPVRAFGIVLSSLELVGVSLCFALIVWWVMLLPLFWPTIVGTGGPLTADLGLRVEKIMSRTSPGQPGPDARRSALDHDTSMVKVRRWRPRNDDASLGGYINALGTRAFRQILRIYDTQEYWVARLTRLSIYCVLYILSTYSMTRRYPDDHPKAGQWDFSQVPSGFIVINYISLWTTFFDYTLEVASEGWSFVTSMASMVELTTQPLMVLIVTRLISAIVDVPRETFSWLGGPPPEDAVHETIGEMWQLSRLSSDPTFYLLQFGFIRFLSAYRVNAKTLSMLEVRSIRIRLMSLALAVMCIFLIIAGAMFTLEARLNEDETFVNYFDFFYFAVVTGSTVGYGDFSPTTPLSRLLCVMAIALTLTWIPEEIKRLQDEMSAKRLFLGIPPRDTEPFVLLCGRVTHEHLRIFLRNFERITGEMHFEPPKKVVVISPDGVDALGLEAGGGYMARSVYAVEGDLLTTLELGTVGYPIHFSMATNVFVFNALGRREEDMDSSTVLRVLALKNFIKPWHMTCMLRSASNLTMLNRIGVQNVLTINDLTMRWLAKSVTDCPGIICLLANLLSSSSEWSHKATSQALSMLSSFDMEHDEWEIQPLDESDPVYGINDGTARGGGGQGGHDVDMTTGGSGGGARGARSDTRGGDAADSQQRWRGSDMREYLVGAQSQLLVHKLPDWSLDKEAKVLYQMMTMVDGIALLAVKHGDNMLIWDENVVLKRGMLGVWMARSEHGLTAFVHSPRPPVSEAAVSRTFPSSREEAEDGGGSNPLQDNQGSAESNRPIPDRVVVCGWPQDVDKLVAVLLSRTQEEGYGTEYLKVTHIAHRAATVDSGDGASPSMRRFKNKYYNNRYQYIDANPLDREVLKQHVLAPGLHSVVIFHSRLRKDGTPQDAVVCAAKVESMLPAGHNVRVVVNMSSTADMRFVERSSWWPFDDDLSTGHLTSPTYASGSVIADEMLYPLMMGWAKDGLIEFCSRLADTLFDPVQLEIFSLPPEVAERAVQMSSNQLAASKGYSRSYTPGSQPGNKASWRAKGDMQHGLRRASRPASLTYEELKIEFMSLGHLVVGLYRQRQDIGTERGLYSLPFVYTNPGNTTRIRSTDRVFALTRGRAAIIKCISRHASSKVVLRAALRIQDEWRALRQRQWLATAQPPPATPSWSLPNAEDDRQSVEDDMSGTSNGKVEEHLQQILDERLDSRLGPLEEKLAAIHDQILSMSHMSQSGMRGRVARPGGSIPLPSLGPPSASVEERSLYHRERETQAQLATPASSQASRRSNRPPPSVASAYY